MVQTLRRLGMLGALVAFASVATGCDRVNGGGWIPSVVPGEKAIFGFTGKCVQGEATPGSLFLFYEGQLQFHDKGANVRFHADVLPEAGVYSDPPLSSCEEAAAEADADLVGEGEALLRGTYRPQPHGAPGQFLMHIADNGEPGINGDVLKIQLIGGQYDGYTNTGAVQHGNIQVG